jgi:hypothetical protein
MLFGRHTVYTRAKRWRLGRLIRHAEKKSSTAWQTTLMYKRVALNKKKTCPPYQCHGLYILSAAFVTDLFLQELSVNSRNHCRT